MTHLMPSPLKSARGQAFTSWLSMMRRCYIESTEGFEHYGGRGIQVCERWFDWRNFLADMGDRPEGHSLDRIDVNDGYKPGNCRWADRVTQARNTTRTVRVEFMGKPMLACEVADAVGVSRSCISRRLKAAAPLGERRPLKLTAAQVSDIKSRLSAGQPCIQIAAAFGVSRQHIGLIRSGRVWARV